MKIGNISTGKLFLAPMSNITNLPFRLLCKRYGASVVYSEMINAEAFVMESAQSRKRGFFLDEERPIGVQLSGSDEAVLNMAANKVRDELRPDFLDINIGCPAYTVMKTGSGASLLKDPKKVGRLVKLLSSIGLPLTCKIRRLNSDADTLYISRVIEEAGAAALTIHGRTARQKYSGKADWDIISKVKEKSGIPIILNGDVKDEQSAKRAFETGADAIMIGRAAIGDPHIFERISHHLVNGDMIPQQTHEQKLQDYLEFIMLSKRYGYNNMASIKMHSQYFTKGIPGSCEIRRKLSEAGSLDEIEAIMRGFLSTGNYNGEG